MTDSSPQLAVLLKQAAETHQAGHLEQAKILYKQLLQTFPDQPDVLHLLGVLLQQTGELTASEQHIRKAIAISPSPSMYCNLGITLERLAKLEEAANSMSEAIRLKPDYPLAYFNLGNIYHAQEQHEKAIDCFKSVIKLNPNHVDAHFNLANQFKHHGNLAEAIEIYKRAILLRPTFAEAYFNLGICYQEQGLPELAILNFRQSLAINPGYLEAHSSLIFTMDMHPGLTVAEIQAERKLWAQMHTPQDSNQFHHHHSRTPRKRLRIGYVSADFRKHSAPCIFGVMLTHYDRDAYEVFAYSNSDIEDSYTHTIRDSVDTFREISHLDDDEIANLIQKDAIDLLVDLSGFSRGNRLPVFARKPAPIQITAWGCIGGTGLQSMDYFFADPILVPLNERQLYTEHVIDLPCAAGYFPLDALPAVNELPSLSGQATTFGSFNRLAKVTPETLEIWAKLLHLQPNSRLILKTVELDQPCERERILGILSERGIMPQRIELIGKTSWYEHMQTYHRVDICLDPFPHCGGVTSLESLIMGVPIVTLMWPTLSGRLTSSFLTILEMPNWIAKNQEDYIEIALKFSMDTTYLKSCRENLRKKMQTSFLGNKDQFVQTVESQYQELWARWCQQ